MGERKVLNKYFPPDFDPAKLPKRNCTVDNLMKVRMMMSMTVQCLSCGVFIYKGTKFNMRKEDVSGMDYLGLQIYRFYLRCPKCASEITFKTDPKHNDYTIEHGAYRTAEPWKIQEAENEKFKKRQDEERSLESRIVEPGSAVDIFADIEEMRAVRGRRDKLGTSSVLDAVQSRAMLQEEKRVKLDDVEIERMRKDRAKYISRLHKEDLAWHKRLVKCARDGPLFSHHSYMTYGFGSPSISKLEDRNMASKPTIPMKMNIETVNPLTRNQKARTQTVSCSSHPKLVDYENTSDNSSQ